MLEWVGRSKYQQVLPDEQCFLLDDPPPTARSRQTPLALFWDETCTSEVQGQRLKVATYLGSSGTALQRSLAGSRNNLGT